MPEGLAEETPAEAIGARGVPISGRFGQKAKRWGQAAKGDLRDSLLKVSQVRPCSRPCPPVMGRVLSISVRSATPSPPSDFREVSGKVKSKCVRKASLGDADRPGL